MQYDKYKVILLFLPDNMCKLHMKCDIKCYYTFENKVNSLIFKPLHLVDYIYNGKVSINDYHIINGLKINDIFPFNKINTLVRDKTYNYPYWFGYFDNIVKFNRYLKIHGSKLIIASLKMDDNVNDTLLFEQIQNFQFTSN